MDDAMSKNVGNIPEAGARVSRLLGDFGEALYHLKIGKKVCRSGWNGKGMFICRVKADQYVIPFPPYEDFKGDNSEGSPESVKLLPWIGMKTAQREFVPWLASQTDLLAEDWELVE